MYEIGQSFDKVGYGLYPYYRSKKTLEYLMFNAIFSFLVRIASPDRKVAELATKINDEIKSLALNIVPKKDSNDIVEKYKSVVNKINALSKRGGER